MNIKDMSKATMSNANVNMNYGSRENYLRQQRNINVPLLRSSEENDWGFDIYPSTKHMYPKFIGDCEKNKRLTDNEKLLCAKTKFQSKLGNTSQQKLRRKKYRPVIINICKRNTAIACNKNNPHHDIYSLCPCNTKSMHIKDIFPVAMNYYSEISDMMGKLGFDRDEKYYKEIKKAPSWIYKKVSAREDEAKPNATKKGLYKKVSAREDEAKPNATKKGLYKKVSAKEDADEAYLSLMRKIDQMNKQNATKKEDAPGTKQVKEAHAATTNAAATSTNAAAAPTNTTATTDAAATT
jgi:hypothetical protein